MQTVAIVGATGAVGRELLAVLEARRYPVGRLVPLASERSHGATVLFRGERHSVRPLSAFDFSGVDVAFFSAGADRSREHAPRAAAAGALVVDNSSAFRADPDVPLVVPEVNGQEAARHRGIVAVPNCTTILLVVVLAPLARLAPLRRVVVSSYQAVSGSGARGLVELERQVREEAQGAAPTTSVYPAPIASNVLPFVQGFRDDGLTVEEGKVVSETRRLLGLPALAVSATCVRVPVRRAHSESVNVEFERPVSPEEARAALRRASGVAVVDDPSRLVFPTPRQAEGRDEVLVGRLRRDPGEPRALDLFLCGDQLRKGAALNAVQIAEGLLAARPAAART
jgi:aspartate-semialdehyde dehydrogenase